MTKAKESNASLDDMGREASAVGDDRRTIDAMSSPQLRFRFYNGTDLASLPNLDWRVKGVLPATGLAAIYGKSGSGKSFLAFDLGAAIQEGAEWFGLRVKAAPVVYVALEGEAGFKHRAQAWELHNGRNLPAEMKLLLGGLRLTNADDVDTLAKVIPAGSTIIIDTLNRAAPGIDENGSRDMGMVLEAAKFLQTQCGCLVIFIHHSGKDSSKGLRGHSSLIAALDAAIEVIRTGEQRAWKVEKSKDGADGTSRRFTLATKRVDADEFGEDITSCAVVPDIGVQLLQSLKVPQGVHQASVFQTVRELTECANPMPGRPQPIGLPAGTLAIELDANLPKIAAKLECASDKRMSRAKDAINGLTSRGVLALADGWLWIPRHAEIIRN